MKEEYITEQARPILLCRWWLRTRPCKLGIQLNNDKYPCVEFYVPFWARPLELIYRLVFGSVKLKK